MKNISEISIREIANHLQNGEVIVLPTDTIYGFSCLPDKEGAMRKIQKLKQRPNSKPFLLLISDFKQLKEYCQVSAQQERILRILWDPGQRPVTVILKNRLDATRTLAVRLPQAPWLIRLIKTLQQPLLSTSVNLSGQKELINVQKIITHFKGQALILQPGLIVKNQGRASHLKPSAIIDLTAVNYPRIIRG